MKNNSTPLAFRFIESVKRFPESNAIYVDNKHYSYNQLFFHSSKIYNWLKSNHSNDKRIAVFDDNNFETYATILAISLINKTFVPLNHKFPDERNSMIIEQSEASLILTTNIYRCSDNLKIKYQSIITELPSNLEDYNNEIDFESLKFDNSEAYILFTSGTTGTPKGVVITNENVNSFFNNFLTEKIYFFSDDKVLQMFDLTFDVATFSFYLPLMFGACAYIVPKKNVLYPSILKMLVEQEITVATLIPSVLNFLKPYFNQLRFPKIKYCIFTGDTLYHDIAKEWKEIIPNGNILNMCGPTETTINCTIYQYSKNISENKTTNGIVPIGKVLKGIDYLLLNEENEIVKDKGELCVSGKQITTSYLNNVHPEKYLNFNDKKYFKTGDIVSINEFGNFNFHGRIDRQIKLNGFRIELNEIEFHIRNYTNKNVVVIVNTDNSNNKSLIAIIENYENLKENIVEYLKIKIPEYMIPSKFISIENIPLNANQKPNYFEILKYIK